MTLCPGKAGRIRHQVKTPGAPGVRAVPTGGARLRGRDCAKFNPQDRFETRGDAPRCGAFGLVTGLRFVGQRALRLCFGAWLGVSLAAGGALATPVQTASDLPIVHHDVIAEPPVYRYRFVLPDLGQPGREFADLSDIMLGLCGDFALPHIQGDLPESEGALERVVISLMSAPVDFGVMSPDVIQFFESFRVENDLCIWEAF